VQLTAVIAVVFTLCLCMCEGSMTPCKPFRLHKDVPIRAAVLIGHDTCTARPSVCLCVVKLKLKGTEKPVGMNVLHGRNNRGDNFQITILLSYDYYTS